MFSRLSRRMVAPAGGAAAAGLLLLRTHTERHLSERAAVAVTERCGAPSRPLLLGWHSALQRQQPLPTSTRFFASSSSSSSTGTGTTTSTGGSGGGFMKWYEGHLQATPVLTKMVTGCFLWSAGDAVAQVVPHYAAAADAAITHHPLKYDWERTGRAALFGFAMHAPLSHLHFNFLEWMTVKLGLQGLAIPVFKTVMEQFVYWSWVSNSLYHGAMAAMQGMNPQQCYDRIRDVLWDTQVAQWKFWIPIQLLNFQFVPVRHQLNVVLLTSIVWTALLSMWYPPHEGEEGEQGEAEQKKQMIQRAATSHA